MVAAFGAWLLLLWWLLDWFRVDLLEPGKTFLVGWLLIVAFLVADLVEYDRILSPAALFSLLGATAAFVAGTLLVRFNRIGSSAPRRVCRAEPLRRLWWPAAIFVAAGTIGYALLKLPEVARLIASGVTATTLLELRAAHIEQSLGARVTPLSALEAVMRVGATMAAVGVPVFLALRQRGLVLLGLVAFGVLALDSALVGGRMLLAYVVLAIGYARMHCSPVSESRRWNAWHATRAGLAVAAFVGLGFAMMVLFPALRNPDLAGDVDFFLGLLHDAKLSDWVVEAGDYVPAGGLAVFAFASSYISQPIVKYTFFLENSDIERWLTLGAYNFPFIAKLASGLFATANPWADIRGRLALVSSPFGYGENPWATGVRDFVVDFGPLGMPLALFCLGALWQYIYMHASSARSAEWRIALALAGPVIFFLPFFSPLPIGIFANTLLVAVGWALLAGIRQKSRVRRAE